MLLIFQKTNTLFWKRSGRDRIWTPNIVCGDLRAQTVAKHRDYYCPSIRPQQGQPFYLCYSAACQQNLPTSSILFPKSAIAPSSSISTRVTVLSKFRFDLMEHQRNVIKLAPDMTEAKLHPPARIPRFPYTVPELEIMAKTPEHPQRRSAQMSLWLKNQPEPPREQTPKSRETVAALDKLTHEWVARCDKFISLAEKQVLQAHEQSDTYLDIAEARYKRNYMYWRFFRVNDLPPEVFTNILRYVIWSTADSGDGVMYRLYLTWTCRRWRRMMISDQTLWSVVWMRDRAPYIRSQVWLDRAGSTPLDIRINERPGEPSFDGKTMERLLNIVFPKLSQLRRLIVILDDWRSSLVLLRKLDRAAAMGIPINLERFELHRAGKPYVWAGPGYDAELVKNPLAFAGGKASRLEYIALNGVYVNWERSHLINLTTLDLRRMALEVSPTLQVFRSILKACPNLHKLALDGAGPKVETETAKQLKPIELPSVRTFVMGDFSLQYALYVLSQISVPNTRDLTLMNMTGEDYSPLLTAMTGTFRNVRLLTLYTVNISEKSAGRRVLIKWLRSVPLVSYLRIAQVRRHIFDVFLDDPASVDSDEPTMPSNDVACLSPSSLSSSSETSSSSFSISMGSSSREVLCPLLRTLEFQSVESNSIIAFGEGRKALGLPLLKIYVNKPWVQRLLKSDVIKLKSLADLLIVYGASPTPEETAVVQD